MTAAAAFPRAALAAAASKAISPVMEKLCVYMADARNQVLPDKVVEEAKHHILDTIAAMVSVSLLIPTKPMMTSPPEEPIPGARWCPRPWLPASNSAPAGRTSCGL
jgi:hypothetical protein